MNTESIPVYRPENITWVMTGEALDQYITSRNEKAIDEKVGEMTCTAKETARHLGISVQLLAYWEQYGIIEPVATKPVKMFRMSDIIRITKAGHKHGYSLERLTAKLNGSKKSM